METKSVVSFDKLKKLVSKEEVALLSKFKARRNYVLGLRSTKIEGLGVGVSEGYFVMLKLSLTFSAVEMLSTAISRKGNLGIRNESFIRALNSGKLDKLITAMDRENQRRFPSGKSELIKKWKNLPVDTDLTKFVYQCRNYMFHGSFTPTETGLSTSSQMRVLILDLAMSTLQAGDDSLRMWAKKKAR
jgi:hypothetical protein